MGYHSTKVANVLKAAKAIILFVDKEVGGNCAINLRL